MKQAMVLRVVIEIETDSNDAKTLRHIAVFRRAIIDDIRKREWNRIGHRAEVVGVREICKGDGK